MFFKRKKKQEPVTTKSDGLLFKNDRNEVVGAITSGGTALAPCSKATTLVAPGPFVVMDAEGNELALDQPKSLRDAPPSEDR